MRAEDFSGFGEVLRAAPTLPSPFRRNLKVSRCSLATTESYKDDRGGLHTHTEWHSLVLWRGLSDLAEKYLSKGSLVYVEGKNRTRSYDDKQGIKRQVTEVVAENIILLDKRAE